MRTGVIGKVQATKRILSLLFFVVVASQFVRASTRIVEIFVTDSSNNRLTSLQRGQEIRLYIRYELAEESYVILDRDVPELAYSKTTRTRKFSTGMRTSYASALVPVHTTATTATYTARLSAFPTDGGGGTADFALLTLPIDGTYPPPTPVISTLTVVDENKNPVTELERGRRYWIDVRYWAVENVPGGRMEVLRCYQVPYIDFYRTFKSAKTQGRYRARKSFIVPSNYPASAGPLEVKVTISQEFLDGSPTDPTVATSSIFLPVVGAEQDPWAEVVRVFVTEKCCRKIKTTTPGKTVYLHLVVDVYGIGDLTRRYEIPELGYFKETTRFKQPRRYHSAVKFTIPPGVIVPQTVHFLGTATMAGGGQTGTWQLDIVSP